jgi:quercetin dioxygenase-like cupin family protein
MEQAKINDLVEFSHDKRVRKRIFLSDDIVSEVVCYEPGQGTPVHHHPRQDEIFYVIEGRGTMSVGEEVIAVSASSTVFVPATVPHGFSAADDSRLVLMFFKGPGRPPRGRDA